MKKLILVIVAFLLVLFITNPTKSTHKSECFMQEYECSVYLVNYETYYIFSICKIDYLKTYYSMPSTSGKITQFGILGHCFKIKSKL